mgnify:CR=1 FL=1
MDAKHWNSVASKYDEFVFNSLAADQRGHMTELLDRFASREKTAGDFGCGVGKYLPALASRFGRIVAMDHSAKCLAVARQACRRFSTINYHVVHMGQPIKPVAKVDFALCANVLLSTSCRERQIMLENIRRMLKAGGRLLLLAPSLESALLTHHRRAEWKRRAPTKSNGWMPGSVAFSRHGGATVANGHLTINRVSTKHHLREELEIALTNAGFKVDEVRKLEYAWTTEFDRPPAWMKAPFPWDWLMVGHVAGARW